MLPVLIYLPDWRPPAERDQMKVTQALGLNKENDKNNDASLTKTGFMTAAEVT